MPLLKAYLDKELSLRDRALLNEIVALGIKTDANLLLDPNAVVAKTNGRVTKATIDGLLDRVMLPTMRASISSPMRASDIHSESATVQHHVSSGWKRTDQLLGGQGWASGEVSEICGAAGAGKTHMCLNSVATMLVNDPTSQAIWVDTLGGEFSAQRISAIIQAQLARSAMVEGTTTETVKEPSTENLLMTIISRIQIYSCRDVYELLAAFDAIRHSLRDSEATSNLTARVLVIDSLSTVLTEVLWGTDGAGHATMMHTSKELRRLASDFNLVTLVTTLSVQLSYPEEQSPSILMASTSKPSLGTSWKYATDLQLFLTRLNIPSEERVESDTKGVLDSHRFGDELPSDGDTQALGIVAHGGVPGRLAELLRSKRLPQPTTATKQFTRSNTTAAMTTEQIDQLRNSSSLIIAAPISKSKVKPGEANYKILLLQRSRLGTSASAHVFPGGNVDKADHDPRWATLLNYQPKDPKAPPLHNAICAIREAFEESGVLVCEPPTELSNDEIRIWRDKVHNNAQEFYNLCTSHHLKPSVDRLCHFSSWITPPVEAKRFHTQFYLTVLPWSRESFSDSRVFADGKETTKLDWFTPAEAIEAYRQNTIQTFLPPQFVSLAHLLPVLKHEDLVQHFSGREVVHTMPEFVLESQDENGIHMSGILPGDEEHSLHVKQGHKHRIHITRNKKGMKLRSYVQGPIEIKARL
ncbi:hypothetical protein BGZ72_010112 [Mortierella alpina]|nr:hypothetical protein BGZ72_010112 [Mortierella alpina]